jgi:Ser/Thr protein kinase RdoA (MazF antagonist)
MNQHWLESIPEPQHASAQQAVSAAFGSAGITFIQRIHGGASGALVFRIEVSGRPYVLRLETQRLPWRNPHQYACLQAAAEAGVAPPVRYADEAAGAVILDFLSQRPLSEFPGGPRALAGALGRLAARLQATEPFPPLGHYRDFIEGLLKRMQAFCAPGLLDPHAEALRRIQEAYPWEATPGVSSHNDPNARNLLFDGERLWLVDWETAFRNDPFTDVAILADNHATSPELEQALLEAWLGRAPGRGAKARLLLMQCITRMWYAGLVLTPPPAPDSLISDLAAPTPDEFRALAATGQLKPGEIKITFGKMMLAGFLAGARSPGFEEALRTAEADRDLA